MRTLFPYTTLFRSLLIEALESIDPQYPSGHFDLAAERARVLAS